MPLETGTYISDLNASNPASSDEVSKADDHLRWIKSAIKATFPSITGVVNATQTLLNYLSSSTGLSVLGRSANTSGEVAPIVGTDGQVLRVSGTTLGFGNIVGTAVDINGMTAETAPATDDTFPAYDTSAAANRKFTLANIWKIISSFSGMSSGQLATGDKFPVYDVSASDVKSVTAQGIIEVINAITEDTAPDQTADFVGTYDTSATVAKKVLLKRLGTGKKKLWIPAGAMKPRTTNGPASGNNETATNDLQYGTLDFDATTEEGAWFSIAMPKGWNEGTVSFRPVWTHGSTTVNFGVVWSLSGVAFSDDDALDAAAGTAQTSTDTGGTTEDLYRGPESSAITIAGTPQAEDVVFFLVKRVVGDASDNMAVDAKLIGIELFVTTDANTED
jgi:hypothetical protein